MRRARVLALAVSFVVAVGTACGTDDGVPTASVGTTPQSSATTSTTMSEPAEGTSTTAPAATVTSPSTTEAPGSTAPPRQTPIGPARPGTYVYDTSGGLSFDQTSIPFPAVTTNVVDPPAGTRQHSRRSLRDASGNGSEFEYTFDYQPQGVYLVALRLTTSVGGVVDTQELAPGAPALFLTTGAGPGWSTSLDLPVTGGGAARVDVSVTGTETVDVGGTPVSTLVLGVVATLPAGQVTGTQALTVNLDPATGLWVKEQGVGDATATLGLITVMVHSEHQAILRSLVPS